MNIILVLSLKGTCMVIGYYMICLVMGNSFSHRMRYFWLKLSLVGYLWPMLWLHEKYIRFFQNKLGMQIIDVLHHNIFEHDKILFQYNDKMNGVSLGLYKDMLFIIIWIAISLAVLIYCLVKFYRSYGKIKRNAEDVRDGHIYEQFLHIKNEYKILRKIRLFLVEDDRNCSSSLVSPFVVMKKEGSLPEYVLKHELMHIKRMDSLFRVLLSLAVCIHWFNPFIYLLKQQLEEECEMSCDDRVLEGCTQKEKKVYSYSLLQRSVKKEKRMPLALHLLQNKKFITRRVENIMEEKKKNRTRSFVCIVLMGTLLFGSSFTVLAYDQIYTIEDTAPRSSGIVKGEAWFLKEDEVEVFMAEIVPPVMCDEQFIDSEGNIYDLTQEPQIYSICLFHQYEPGQLVEHERDGNGGCDITVYYADKCSKCGHLRKGDYMSSVHNAVCTH